MLYRADSDHDLYPDEIDANFRELRDELDAFIAIGGINGIDDFTVVGDQMTVHMTDHSTRGPFTIPSASWNDTGAWQAGFLYALRDTFSINGATYEVIFPHTSALTFDANANNGMGDDYYHRMLSSPENTLPEGGSPRMVVMKSSAADFDMQIDFVNMEDLGDFALNSPISDGDVVTWDDGINKFVPKPISIPPPTNATLGGLFSDAGVAGEFVTSINHDGTIDTAPVTWADISGPLPAAKDLRSMVQSIEGAGAVSIDLDDGWCIYLNVSANVTSLTFTNWTDALILTDIKMFVYNNGAFTVASPAGAIFPGSTNYVATSGADKWDRVDIESIDGGSTIHVTVKGLDYAP